MLVATKDDPDAMRIVARYLSYIACLSTRIVHDESAVPEINEDMCERLQAIKLMWVVLQFDLER